jgi:predicted TIM-barrel fold metal-dependent hydrolase
MWASDFPHVTSTWPNSRQVIDENFSSVPEQVKNKIVFENAKRLYRIELSPSD